MDDQRTEVIMGVMCKVRREKFPDGYHEVYTFTVGGWPECTVTGRRTAKRVINARLDPSVRKIYGIDKDLNQKE